jgi:hypothetical protein
MKKYNRTQKTHRKTSQPDKGGIEIVDIAEAPEPKTSCPVREVEPETSFRQRREHRLIPVLPPITPASQW